MSQKIENDPKGEQEERVYYVENVEGDDFTFYLDFDEDNKRLLTGETVHQAEEQQTSKEGFSNSTKLKVRILPLLTEKDLIEEGRNLLDKLKEAIEESQSEPESETAWSKLVGKFPEDLKGDIRTDWQKAEAKDALLQKILKQLNSLLTTEVMAEFLNDHVDDLDMAEKELLKNFSESGQQIYTNRKKFNRHCYEAIEPFQPPLPEISGRALICRTYQGKFLSISFRKKPSKSSYAPSDSDSIEYPLSIKSYCRELYEALFEFESKGSAKRGLLIIAGATNSSKSEIATGLIYTYLDKRREDSKGRPHLVTFEDPIEKFYELPGKSIAPNFSVAMLAAKNGVDYTPREKGNAYEKDKDVESLKEALEDALRQTPTVLFVGETRDKGDWRRLVDFAGTGHLIVTTAHAGSLTEAMHKIFVALKIRTPAERSEIANRLLGIIHIKRHADTNILVPAVWRRTPTGKNALTAEGLSSLLPYRPEGYDAEKGCLGRAWFVKNLVKRVDASKLSKEKRELLEREAIKWDLEGV